MRNGLRERHDKIVDHGDAMGEFTLTHFKEKDLKVGVHSGICGSEDALRGIKEYYAGPITRYSITDFSQAELIKITGDDIAKLAAYMSKASKVRPPYSVDILVVSDMLKFGLARMYASFVNMSIKNVSDLKTEVFRTMEDAMQWLDKDMRKAQLPG